MQTDRTNGTGGQATLFPHPGPYGEPPPLALPAGQAQEARLVNMHPSALAPPRRDIRDREDPSYLKFFHEQLVPDVRERGVQQPVIAYVDAGRPRVLDGWTRVLASLMAGRGSISVLLHPEEPSNEALDLAQWQANAMRRDATLLESARAFKALMEANGWSQMALAQRLHLSQGTVSKTLAVLTKLPDDVQAMIGEGDGKLCVTAAAALTKLASHDDMREVAAAAAAGGLKRDAVEALVKRKLGARGKKARVHKGRTARGIAYALPAIDFKDLLADLKSLTDGVKRCQELGLELASLPSVMK